jgi:regulator of protease activity HflC (stomatin/prohibitin superfamily)
MDAEELESAKFIRGTIFKIIGGVLMFTLLAMWGCPNYSVYQQNLEGEAELARATQNRQIKIQEAQATKESAKDLADAEVIRATGAAQANKIIGESLKSNEAYLHYLFINNMENTKNQVIYIPTEASLPILESRRLTQRPE